ncbi:HDOD domain-containing protein [Halomonas sp. HP20-15]|uniref:EAL and HDOD domain-containing protein n=1 Tax=Halomonas sp. HP20-15 TaxID=3085901 RepID=UPI002980EC53|nr:HDOD domain-containing protein [Halomonas sp. HP20-15]MDW5378462.1 HDOD domain-containing protein [Halomonas sp. HP20-15]
MLFARQPIYDRQRALAGFELLFRSCAETAGKPFNDDYATRQVMLSAFTETNIHEVCEGTPAFINFHTNTLQAALPFSPDEMIIEVLETVAPTPAVEKAIRYCKTQGYRIALDDYALTDASHPLLPLADIVKLDCLAYSAEHFATAVAALRRAYPSLKLVAEKVETGEDFTRCLTLGCDLFQGYFLARPMPVHGKRLPSSRLSVLQLLAELNRPDNTLATLTATIQRDAFISVRLMKMANSAYYSRNHDIKSVHMAVNLLGQRRIRSLASLLALTKLDDKPHALQKLALARGYLCQELADALLDDPGSGFTVGLFSCLDALFDHPLEAILAELPLHDSLKTAIHSHHGALGLILASVLKLERGELDGLDWSGLNALGLTPKRLSRLQQQAIEMTNGQL